MSILQTNLDEILAEKEAKILPENIKKGVKIFDIEGVLESGGGSGDVKLFTTKTEMNADTTAEDGDLAIVYEDRTSKITQDTVLEQLVFPNKVTLPEKITSNSNCYYTDADNKSRYRVQLSANAFAFVNQTTGSTASYIIRYNSSDGINYTKNSSMLGTYTLDTPLTYSSGTWKDVYGEFIKSGAVVFDGLYKYDSENNKYSTAQNQFSLISPSQLLPGIKAYGANGIVTGNDTIYEKLNWSTDIVAKMPTDVFLEYHNLPTRYTTDAISSPFVAERPNLLFGVTDGESSMAIRVSVKTDLITKYAETIEPLDVTRSISNYCAIYDNKLIWNCVIGAQTDTQSLYLVYYDYSTKMFGHVLVDDNLTNITASQYFSSFCVDEKDGALCICNISDVDGYTDTDYNGFIYKWCIDGTFKQLFYNSFDNFDTDITTTSSSTLYSCGVVVYDDTVYLGYNRYVSSKMYVRLVKLKNNVRTNIISYTATALDYIPRFSSWFGQRRMYIDGDIAYFINHTNSTEYLSSLNLSTGQLTNLKTLSYSYYKENRAYNTEGFYKYNDSLYFCISYATVSSSSSSGGDYSVQIYKYNITTNSLTNLGYSTYTTLCRGDEDGRLIGMLEGNMLYFKCSDSTIEINVVNDTFEITTSTKPPIIEDYPYYLYNHNNITYIWGNTPYIMLEHKSFTNLKLDGLVFVSSSKDTSVYTLFNLDMDNQYTNTISPEEYTQAQEQINDLFGEGETE